MLLEVLTPISHFLFFTPESSSIYSATQLVLSRQLLLRRAHDVVRFSERLPQVIAAGEKPHARRVQQRKRRCGVSLLGDEHK